MCAMMPIFRNRFKSYFAMPALVFDFWSQVIDEDQNPKTVFLPFIVRECFIRVGHAMRVFFLLDRVAPIVRRVQQFSRESISHSFLATPARELNNPANSKRPTSLLMHFHWNLVGGSSYASRFHLDGWPNIFNRPLENLEGLFSRLISYLSQGIIERSLGQRFFSAPHHAI